MIAAFERVFRSLCCLFILSVLSLAEFALLPSRY
jgi:hypothetical protein